jgi:hypothetical protein
MTLLVVAGGAAFFAYMLWRPGAAETPFLALLKPGNRMLAPLWRRVSPGLQAEQDSDDEVDRDLGRLLLLL